MHAIKLAIGATPARVARSVISFAVVTAAAGMAAGYLLLVPVAKVLEPLLFHTRILEPVTVATVLAFGAVIAMAAAFLP